MCVLLYVAVGGSSDNICFVLWPKGVVAFSSQGDRIALTQVEQMIDGKYTKLGYYDTQADNLTWTNREQWATSKVSCGNTLLVELNSN